MRKRIIAVAVLAVVVLAGATLAFGGARGLIWDDGHYAKPGSLDDGKELLSQTGVSLPAAVPTPQGSPSGALGQVHLEPFRGAIVYSVDVGDKEVRVDAANGKVVAVIPL